MNISTQSTQKNMTGKIQNSIENYSSLCYSSSIKKYRRYSMDSRTIDELVEDAEYRKVVINEDGDTDYIDMELS